MNAIQEATPAPSPPVYVAKYRFPNVSKRWKTLGRYKTEAEASQALWAFIATRTERFIDQWTTTEKPHPRKPHHEDFDPPAACDQTDHDQATDL